MADDTGPKVAVVLSALAALGIVLAALVQTPRLCAPGQQKPCSCEDPSASGVQSCSPDGASWGACGQCPAPSPAAFANQAAEPLPAASAVGAPGSFTGLGAGTGTCKVKVGTLKVTNRKLSAEAVVAEVARAETALNQCCLGAVTGKTPPVRGVARLTVGRDGKVVSVVNAGRGPAAALLPCALDAFRPLAFAAACRPEGAKCNAATSLEVPLEFGAE